MNFKTPFKVLTTAALIGTLSLSAVAPGAASAAEKTVTAQAETPANFAIEKVILVKGDSKISVSFDTYIDALGNETALNGYELAYVVAANGEVFALDTYVDFYEAGNTEEEVVEKLSKAGKTSEVTEVKDGAFNDGKLEPVEDTAATAKADLEKAVAAAKATEIKDAAAKAELTKAIEAAEKAAAKEDATKEELEAAKAELTKAVEAAKKADAEAALEAKVESVTAINATTIEVKFNKAIDASTVIGAASALKNITLTQVGQTATVGLTAKLSDDKKTLTIKNAAGFASDDYAVKVTDSVKDLQGNKVPTTTKIVKVEDEVAPTYVDYKQINASTFEFNFSEDLAPAEGSVSLKAADGTTISVVVPPSVEGSKITVVLPGTVQAGKEVKVSFTGQKDFAGNVLETPFDVTIKKGALDGEAPAVSSVKPINGKKFEIKFSEEVQGFSAADLSVAGTTIKSVTQDKEDKTKYVVELKYVVTGLTKIAVTEDSYQDLSGELGKAYSQLVKFDEDTTKPTVEVEASKDEDGKQILTFTTSEDATVKATGTITLPATAVKNFVTSTGNITFAAADLTVVPKTSNKYTVALADVKYASAALETDTEYTVSLAADIFEDVAENTNEAKTDAFKFTREADKDNAKPVLTDTDVVVVDNNKFTVDFGTSLELDNATVVNPANYSVAGATVESVTLADDGVATVKLAKGSVTSTGDRIVKVKGIKAKNGNVMDDFTTTKTFNENVAPTITKVALTDVEKAKAAVTTATNASVAIEGDNASLVQTSGSTTVNGTAIYKYNGLAWVKKSGDDLTGLSVTTAESQTPNENDEVTVTTTGGIPTSAATPGATEVTLTLSEDVTATEATDYTVNVDGKALDGITATVQAQGAAKNVVVIKINKELTDAEFAKGVTLTSDDYKIVDDADNKVDIAKEGIKVEQ